jgi:hypothetical protein
LIRRLNARGRSALDDLPRSGHPGSSGAAARARIEQELLREPSRQEESTATWSLSTLQRARREASDGLPAVRTFPIVPALHEAGYSWQQSRTWGQTGTTVRKRTAGTVEERSDPSAPEKNGD